MSILPANQIHTGLPASAWEDVTIQENNKSLALPKETNKLVFGTNILKGRTPSFLVRATIAKMPTKASELLPNGYQLVIIEGYRSTASQQQAWEACCCQVKMKYPKWSPEEIEQEVKKFVAKPNPLANHNCGGAVDVTLSFNGELCDMGTLTTGQSVSKLNYMEHPDVPKAAADNRAILREAMTQAGFVFYPLEWWHYCYGDRMWAVYTKQKRCFYGPVKHNKGGRYL